MDTIKLIARNGDAVREAIEFGDIVHMVQRVKNSQTSLCSLPSRAGYCRSGHKGFLIYARTLKSGWMSSSQRPWQRASRGSIRSVSWGMCCSQPGVGRVGLQCEVIKAGKGMSRRGTGDEQVISGDVLRKLLVQMEQHITLSTDALAGEVVDTRVGRVRERGSRLTVKGQVDGREVQARGRGVGEQLTEWYTHCVGVSLLAYAQVGVAGAGKVDCTKVEVPLDSGHYECSGVVKNDDGSLARGYKLATIRTLLDTAGVFTQVAVAPIQVHDVEVCRSMLLSSPTLRVGDLLLEDNGFMDGTIFSAQTHAAGGCDRAATVQYGRL